MKQIDFSESNIDSLSVHHIGNPIQEEELRLSHNQTHIHDEVMEGLLMTYFLKPFTKQSGFYYFREGAKIAELSKQFFESGYDQRHAISIQIAQLLFQNTNHPNIKTGDLNVVMFNGVGVNGFPCKALGLFKTEGSETFISSHWSSDNISMDYQSGNNDKSYKRGVLIYEIESSEGYHFQIVDKAKDAKEYWKDNFLNAEVLHDSSYYTENHLSMMKGFVDNVFNEEHNVGREEQVDMNNRVIKYYETGEVFDKETFENEVLLNGEVIDAYEEYRQSYQEDTEKEVLQEFDIDLNVVKSNKKHFKSKIKLDTNFTLEVHKKNESLEKGQDEDGRKFYKIYYKEES